MIVQDVKKLEERSIFIMREAKQKFKNMGAFWSMGKDSTTMLAVARKAFLGKVPFPVIHIDNGIDFPEVYAFREKMVREWGLELIVGHTKIKPVARGMACCGDTKTEAVKELMKKYKFDALMVSIRRDEHWIRAKERYFCFPQGSVVYGEAIKRIEDVREGDLVFTHLGSTRKVLGISKRYYSGPMLSILTEYSNMPLNLTPNHVVLGRVSELIGKESHVVAEGFDGIQRQITIPLGTRRIRWIRAEALNRGDRLWVPKLPKKSQDGVSRPVFVPLYQFLDESKIIKKGRRFKFKSAHTEASWTRRSLPLEPEVLRVVGYYTAEGSANHHSNQLSFAFNKKETRLINDVLVTIREFFGIRGSIRQITENGVSVSFNSKPLVLALSGLCGEGPRNKKLPYFFTSLSKMQLRELVKGCWLGDGSHETYSTTSFILAHQLRMALLRLKVLTAIREMSDGRYVLQIAGVSKERFTALFGIEPSVPYVNRLERAREVSHLHSTNLPNDEYGKSRAGGFWVKIKQIGKTHYDGYVYDLEVDQHSSYVVSGIAVHNSPRDQEFKWNYKDQPAELWDDYTSKLDLRGHIRIHPMLDWNEVDIWSYVKKYHVPVMPVYYSRNGWRYRSVGCTNCTVPLKSNAKNINDIIKELEATETDERSGRSQDKEREYAMQRLRALGYM